LAPVAHWLQSASSAQAENSLQQAPSKQVWQAGSAVKPHLAPVAPPHSSAQEPLMQP
jgi:hypothetical protein